MRRDSSERYAGNVYGIHQSFGDLDKAFAEADLVRDDTFEATAPITVSASQASLAVPEGGLIICGPPIRHPTTCAGTWRGCWAFREPVCGEAGHGGGFGGKAEATKLDFLSVIAAQRTGRPVLMTLDREQVFEQGRGRHRQKIRLRTAFRKDGTLLGMHEEAILDGGAYTSYGIITAYYSGSLTPTPYRLPAFRYDGKRVVTNLPACGAQRGNGTPYPRFAIESQLDLAARDLGLDPAAIRAVNLLDEGDVTVNGLQITSCGIRQCLEEATRISGFNGKYGRLPFGRGVGMGLGCFISGASGSIVRGDLPIPPPPSGWTRMASVWLFTGAPRDSQGPIPSCARSRRRVGYSLQAVSIISSDSAVSPKGSGGVCIAHHVHGRKRGARCRPRCAQPPTFGGRPMAATKRLCSAADRSWARARIHVSRSGGSLYEKQGAAGGPGRLFPTLRGPGLHGAHWALPSARRRPTRSAVVAEAHVDTEPAGCVYPVSVRPRFRHSDQSGHVPRPGGRRAGDGHGRSVV